MVPSAGKLPVQYRTGLIALFPALNQISPLRLEAGGGGGGNNKQTANTTALTRLVIPTTADC